MTKLTKKQIRAIVTHTPAELRNQPARLVDTLGYYQPSNANWSYRAGWTSDGALVVDYFGKIL